VDISEWLRGLGLEHYEAAFRDHEIDWSVLAKLTADDLKDIGVAAVGHRRKLLEAIAELAAPSLTFPRWRGRRRRRHPLRPSGGSSQ
jgi:uncharacterized protein YjiS (DUF1127 family)